MRLTHGWICAVLFIPAGLVGQEPPPLPSPQSLFEEAYSLAANLPAEERADLLLELADASVLRPARSVALAEELLDLATTKLTPGPYRAAMQKNALMTISRADPIRAAQLYMMQDSPARPLPREDVRSFGARLLFSRLWDKLGERSLEDIKQIAVWLGETGQYPYVAVAMILPKVAEKDAQEASELFVQAVSFFARDPGFAVTNQDFVDFLLRTWKIAGPGLARSAIESALSAIGKAADSGAPTQAIEVTVPGGSFRLDAQSDLLVYRLLPVIRELDPRWAESVVKEHSALRAAPQLEAGAPVRAAAAMATESKVQPVAMRNALDQHRLMQLPDLAKSDPDAALRSLLMIADQARRSVGMASLLPAFERSDPKRATAWRRELEEQLGQMKTGAPKLQLMAALARSLYESGRVEEAESLVRKAMSLGSEVIALDLEANPGKMLYAAEGFDDLSQLVTLAAERSPKPFDILQAVRNMEHDLLRARMLVCAAKGFLERRKG